MAFELEDNIAALASAPGSAERGIIRISGSSVAACVARHFHADAPVDLNASTRATCFPGHIQLRAIDEKLPTDLLLWPTKRSYTGQPMAELHTIGSPPLLDAILAQLYEDGVRPARNGEFTLRAFLSGRIDLIQAEAVLGVIDATDQEQMERALKQLGGGVSGRLMETRVELIAILGDLEAGLDFVEEDIEFIPAPVMIERLNVAIERLTTLASSSSSRMETSVALPVVLAGLPNAGKSTLFNALAELDLAIVSEVAGTTRDYLNADVDCDGLIVRFVDTAGQEDSDAGIMQIAQQLRTEQLAEAHLIVWCSASSLTGPERLDDDRLRAEVANMGSPVLHVITKADIAGECSTDTNSVVVSAESGEGITELRRRVASVLQSSSGEGDFIGSTGARCRESLTSAIGAMRSARDSAEQQLGDEIIAIELRSALDSIGEILGTVYTDDILDHIFSNFCIGK